MDRLFSKMKLNFLFFGVLAAQGRLKPSNLLSIIYDASNEDHSIKTPTAKQFVCDSVVQCKLLMKYHQAKW